MKITVELLRKKGACKEQMSLFKELFPNGVIVTKAGCLAVADKFNWYWAAHNLLNPNARKAYYEAVAPLSKAYYEAVARASKAYYEAVAPISKAYDEACAPINKAYYEACAHARKAYDEACAPINKAYDEAVAIAFAEATKVKR